MTRLPETQSGHGQPVLLSVDDDSNVLRAIELDLRSRYGAGYRVIGSDSPEAALDILKQAHEWSRIFAGGNALMPSGRSLTAYGVMKASISAKYSLLLLETLGSSQRTFVPAIGRPA
jgi:hypothetical protein